MTAVLRPVIGCLSLVSLVIALTSCGGGSDGGVTSTGIVDSFGRAVDSGDGSGVGIGDAGADGTAGEGAPIAGATITIVDANGKTVSAVTDAQGYYRAKVTGFAPPMVLTATKKTGEKLRSFTLTPLKTNGFVAANVSGVTDKIASDVAVAAGKKGAADLTPQIVAANPTAVASAKAGVQATLSAVIAASGIGISSYDPINTPFFADHTGYDKVLDNTKVSIGSTGATQLAVAPTFTTPFLSAAAGVWSVFSPSGADLAVVFRFTSQGAYLMGDAQGGDAPGGTPGLERGIVAVDPVTSRYVAGLVAQDTNGTSGLSNRTGDELNNTIKAEGGELVVRNSANVEQFRFKRVANDPASVVGAWAMDTGDASLAMQHFVFFPDGVYMMIDPVGDTAPSRCGGPGIEYGHYTFNAATRALTFTGTAIDTNGCAGGHDTTSTQPPQPIIITFGPGGTAFSGGTGADSFVFRRVSQ